MARLILDRYRPMGTAGSGGFGTVRIAWDTRIQRTVAIKCIELTDVEAACAASTASADRAYHPDGASHAEQHRWLSGEALDEALFAHDMPHDPRGGWLSGSDRGDGFGDARDAVEPPPWDDAWGEIDVGDVDGSADAGPVPAETSAWKPVTVGAREGGERKRGMLAEIGARFGHADASAEKPASEQARGRTVVFSRDDEGDAAGACGETPREEAWGDAHWLANVPGLDEARTAAMLSDPNIVTVYDFEVQGSTAYLIMEYVDGLTLAQILRERDDEITLDIVASVLADVSHALEVAHKNQVLHLDIKPDNILIDGEGRAKVTDFGLATLADAQGLGTTGGGTIGYMPLEQIREQSLDARTDEWALASVVYEMLCGENPFRAPDLARAEEAIEDAELVVPSLVWDGLDADADDAVFYALDPDPDERFETVAEFADELAPHLGSVKRGRKQLAAIVAGLDDDDEPADDEPAPAVRERAPRVPLADRLTPRRRAVLAHAFGAAASAFVMALALACSVCGDVSWVGAPVIGVGLAAAALCGAIRPHVGALVSCAALGVSLAFAHAPVAGIAIVAATVCWWVFVGREGRAQANVALTFVLLAAVPIPGAPGFAVGAALAAGGLLRVRDAAASAAFGFVGVVVVSGAADAFFGGGAQLAGGYHASAFFGALVDAVTGGSAASSTNASASMALDVQRSIAEVLVHPETWATLIGWVGAAALFSACCRRGAVALAIVGALAGAAVVAACAIGVAAIGVGESPDAVVFVANILPAAICAGVAVGLIASLGVPQRR